MSDEELTKEQKLEAARKKFEELKNKKTKKKGKKKGKKSDSKEDTPVDDTTEDSVEPTDELKEEKIELKTESETEVVEISGLENKAEDTEAPLKEEESDTTSKEEHGADSKEQLGSTPREKENLEEIKLEDKASDEDTITEGKVNEVVTLLKEPSTILEDSTNDEPLEDILSSDVAPGIESTFLKSTLQSNIDELKSQLEESMNEIKQLKTENSDLKLSKMDVEMELESARNDLETQKAKINTLTQQISKLRVDSNNIPIATVKSDDGSSILSGTDYLNHTSSFQNLSSFNNMSSDYMEIVDIKERLNQWKGWNMDMRSWRSIGMGPYLEL